MSRLRASFDVLSIPPPLYYLGLSVPVPHLGVRAVDVRQAGATLLCFFLSRIPAMNKMLLNCEGASESRPLDIFIFGKVGLKAPGNGLQERSQPSVPLLPPTLPTHPSVIPTYIYASFLDKTTNVLLALLLPK